MDRTKRTELTVMVMVTRGGAVVVQERAGRGWDGLIFPGGHVEQGESFADAARREVREETGLEVKELTFCGVVHWAQRRTDERYLAVLFRHDVVHQFHRLDDAEGIPFFDLGPDFDEGLGVGRGRSIENAHHRRLDVAVAVIILDVCPFRGGRGILLRRRRGRRQRLHILHGRRDRHGGTAVFQFQRKSFLAAGLGDLHFEKPALLKQFDVLAYLFFVHFVPPFRNI